MGAPDSSDILTNYKAYVKMISDVNEIVVKNKLTDKKTFIILNKFNKQFPEAITELVNSMRSVDAALMGMNIKDTTESLQLVSKGIGSSIGLIKSIGDTFTPVLFVKFKIGMMLFDMCWRDIFIVITEIATFTRVDKKTGKKFPSKTKLKNSINTINDITKIADGLSVIINTFSQLGSKSIKAKAAMKGVLAFWNKLIDTIDKMSKPKNMVEIKKSIPTLLAVFNVIKAMKSVMGAVIIIGIGSIVAIPALLSTMLFMFGLKFLIKMMTKMNRSVVKSILVCSFLKKFAFAMLLTVISMMMVGFFVMKWGNLLIKGFMVFMLVTIGLVLFMAIIAMAKPIINKGIKELLLMVIALFITCLGFIAIAELTKKMTVKQFLVTSAIMLVCVGIFILLALSSRWINKGGLEMMLMSVSLLIIIGALWLGSVLLGPIKAKTFVKLAIIIACVIGIYAIIGIPVVAALVALGAVVMGLVGVSLIIFSLGMLSVSLVSATLNKEAFGKLAIIVACVIGIYAIIGIPVVAALVALGAVVMGLVGVSLVVFSLGMLSVSLASVALDEEAFDKLFKATEKIVKLYLIIGLPFVLVSAALGSVAMTIIGASLIVFSLGLLSVSLVARTIKPEVFKNMENIMPSIVSLYKTAFKSLFWITLGSPILLAIGVTTGIFAVSLLVISKAGQKFNPSDVEKVLTAMGTIIDSISNLKIDHKLLWDAMWKLAKLNVITLFLSGMAMTLSKIAKLEIADKWNNDGKPIHFTPLTKDDFQKAADNVRLVATEICNIVRNLDIPDINWDDMFGLVKINIVTCYLSGMAMTVSKIARLQIPDAWNKDGKPISFTKLTTQDFKDAAENIKTVATSIIGILNDPGLKKAVASVKPVDEYDWLGGKKEQTTDIDVLSQFFVAAGNVSKMVEVVTKCASMQVADKWDSKGQPIHYRQLTMEELKSATPVVCAIATSLMTALTDKNLLQRMRFFESTIKDVMGPFFDAASKVGDLVDVVTKLATGSYPIEFNEKSGKPKKYGSFTDLINGTGLLKITTNITAVVTCLSKGIMDAMSKFTEADLKAMNKKVDNIMQITQPVSDMVDVIGKINENTAFKNFDAEKYLNNIDAMFRAIINPFKDESILNSSDIDKIKNKIPVFTNVNEVFARLVEVDNSKYTGNVNKVSNATNDFLKTLNSVDPNKLDSMDRISNNMTKFSESINGNFDALATALSEKLVKVIEDLNLTLTKTQDKLDGIKDSVTYTSVGKETGQTGENNNEKTLVGAIKELKNIFKNEKLKVDIQNDILKVKY